LKAFNAYLAGLLFGAGLLLSRMVNPNNVLAFLDFTGHWNAALVFTMAGAIAVAMPAFAYARWTRRTVLGEALELPDRSRVDSKLIVGAIVFGVGWGASGICPGPGLLLLSRGDLHAAIFVAGLVIGTLAGGILPSHWLAAKLTAGRS
jgi:uncharacterized protein